MLRVGKRLACAVLAGVCLMGAAVCRGADGPTFAVTQTLKIGGAGGWDYVTLSDDGKRLYIPRGTHMQVVDVESGKVVADIPGSTKAHGVVLVPAANRGFITFGGDGAVVVFDLTTNKVLGSVKTEADADGIFFDSGSNRVVLVSGDGNSLWEIAPDIDPVTGKAEGPLALGGAPESFAVDGQGKAYVNLMDKNQVAVVDTKGMKVLAHWGTGNAKLPVGMGFDPATRRLFLGCRSKQMVVMSADDGKVLAELPIGVGVDATVFDGKYAFASCGDGTLAVVGEKSPGEYAVLQTVATPVGARTMTLNKATDVLYLPTADVEAPAAGAKPARPKFLADTFKIVVVSGTPTK